MKILGIDLGSRHVGIAVWDDPEVPARPLTTLEVSERTIVARIAALVAEAKPSELVVGLPLRLDGREGLAARGARKLAAALHVATGLQVSLEDERLTTSQAHGNRVAAGVKGREGIDSRAAAILLQTFVDRRSARWRADDADHNE